MTQTEFLPPVIEEKENEKFTTEKKKKEEEVEEDREKEGEKDAEREKEEEAEREQKYEAIKALAKTPSKLDEDTVRDSSFTQDQAKLEVPETQDEQPKSPNFMDIQDAAEPSGQTPEKKCPSTKASPMRQEIIQTTPKQSKKRYREDEDLNRVSVLDEKTDTKRVHVTEEEPTNNEELIHINLSQESKRKSSLKRSNIILSPEMEQEVNLILFLDSIIS
jgi:hypothetical protein